MMRIGYLPGDEEHAYFVSDGGTTVARIDRRQLEDVKADICLEHANFSGIPGVFVGPDCVDEMLGEISGYRRRKV